MTNPGAYNGKKEDENNSQQFSLEDTRTQLEVVKKVVKQGHLPSFCTACYRLARTGKDFMALAKIGNIKNFCIPTSVLTFKEYILDYGDKEIKKDGENIINKTINTIPDKNIREKTKLKLKAIEQGDRDLYF